MIPPPNLYCMRARLMRALGALLLWVLALVAVPVALAGDQFDPETTIVTGPPPETSSTTADFTFESTAPRLRTAFYCRLDGDELTEYVLCETPWHVEGLEPGYHSLWVYSVNLDNGRPDPSPALWEWMVVPEGPPLDAGSPDGGGDAGPGDVDGGTSGNEDGGGSGDAGPGDTDGGTSGGGDGGASGDEDGGAAGSDGGTAGNEDAGPSGGDGGSPGNDDAGSADDAGTPGGDGGTSDAGTPGDDGPSDPPPSDGDVPTDSLDYLGGGVGCAGAPAPGAVVGLLLLALALRRRRRP